MKKMQILAAMTLAFCGSMTCSYADDAAPAVTATATMSTAEQAFAAQLTEANSAMFSSMTAAEKAAVMTAAQGNTMTPDQSVEQAASAQ